MGGGTGKNREEEPQGGGREHHRETSTRGTARNHMTADFKASLISDAHARIRNLRHNNSSNLGFLVSFKGLQINISNRKKKRTDQCPYLIYPMLLVPTGFLKIIYCQSCLSGLTICQLWQETEGLSCQSISGPLQVHVASMTPDILRGREKENPLLIYCTFSYPDGTSCL